MTTKRMSRGISFTQCPECAYPIGQRGLARHREQAHGVAPVVSKRRKSAAAPAMSPAEAEIAELLATAGGDREAVARALSSAEAFAAGAPGEYDALRAALAKA